MEKIKGLLNEQTRAYIYRVLVAVGPIVAFYGLMSADEVTLWLGVAVTALNIMPAANTSTKAND